MSGFLIDANVLVYAVADDEPGERCRALLLAVASGELDGRTSTAVLEEVWHVELSGRIEAMAGQTRRAYRLLEPLLGVDDGTFAAALELHATAIGANDRIHVATCLEAGLGRILSADGGFEAVGEIKRIDPLDPGAAAALA